MTPAATNAQLTRLALEDGLDAVNALSEEWSLTGQCDGKILCGNATCSAIGCLVDKRCRIERALAKARIPDLLLTPSMRVRPWWLYAGWAAGLGVVGVAFLVKWIW